MDENMEFPYLKSFKSQSEVNFTPNLTEGFFLLWRDHRHLHE